MLNNYK